MNERIDTRQAFGGETTAARPPLLAYLTGRWACWVKALVACVSLLPALAWAEDEPIDAVRIGTTTYSNVTVVNRTTKDVFIKFTGGMANIKVKSLDLQTAALLGYEVAPPRTNQAMLVVQRLQADPRVKQLQATITHQVRYYLDKADPRLLWGMLGGVIFLYTFFCYCCMLICQKTGFEAGAMVWLPVFQVFPLLRAAGMPAWWFLWLLVPGLNLVAGVVWCIKIALARNKTFFTALMLMLPVTTLFAFLYLAFSGIGGEAEGELRPATAS